LNIADPSGVVTFPKLEGKGGLHGSSCGCLFRYLYLPVLVILIRDMDLITSLGNSLTFHVLFGNYSIDRFFQKRIFPAAKEFLLSKKMEPFLFVA
jgi:hypothetical protein